MDEEPARRLRKDGNTGNEEDGKEDLKTDGELEQDELGSAVNVTPVSSVKEERLTLQETEESMYEIPKSIPRRQVDKLDQRGVTLRQVLAG